MKWLCLTVYTSDEALELVSGLFYAEGIQSVEIGESSEAVRKYFESTSQYWDYVADEAIPDVTPYVRAYIAANEEGERMADSVVKAVEALKKEDIGIDFGTLQAMKEEKDDSQWKDKWKQFFKPIKAGSNIVIRPSWEEYEPEEGEIVFVMENSGLFGTGQHESTRLCIGELEKHVGEESDVLDIGCGSGILSIISYKIGAGNVTAVDIEPNVHEVVNENAALNDVDPDRLSIMMGDVLTDEELGERIGRKKYDVIVSNIVADVIIALAPKVEKWLNKDGVWISSGIIDDRKKDVEASIRENGFELLSEDRDNGWVCLTARKAGGTV